MGCHVCCPIQLHRLTPRPEGELVEWDIFNHPTPYNTRRNYAFFKFCILRNSHFRDAAQLRAPIYLLPTPSRYHLFTRSRNLLSTGSRNLLRWSKPINLNGLPCCPIQLHRLTPRPEGELAEWDMFNHPIPYNTRGNYGLFFNFAFCEIRTSGTLPNCVPPSIYYLHLADIIYLHVAEICHLQVAEIC